MFILARLWEGDLRRDEVLYAAIAKGIGGTSGWLDLHLGADPYWKKPPLVMWLAAGAYRLLGITSFSARLVPASCGVLACLALWALGRRLFSERVGLLAACMLATTPGFFRPAATLNLDTPVVLATLGAVLLASDPRPATLALAGVVSGLAVMAKGAFGLLPPVVVLAYLATQGRLRMVASVGFVAFVAATLAVALPWHVHEVLRWGPGFLHTYVGEEVMDRAAGRLWLGYEPESYLVELLRDDWLWLALTVVGSVVALARARRRDRAALFALVWGVGYLIALHASVGRRGQYLMHFYAPASLLAALGLERLLPARGLAHVPRVAATLAAAAGIALLCLPVSLHSPRVSDVRLLGPALAVLAPGPPEPLIGFRANAHVRAASLVYLDRDVVNRPLAAIPRDGRTVVLAERRFGPRLAADGFASVYANRHYELFQTRP